MSKADRTFKEMYRNIKDNGIDVECRAIWPDTGEKAHTIKTFGVVNRYNLQEEFPALTLRKTALKTAMDEILWIYQKKSNDIRLLNSSIWNQWADEDKKIGKAYGYQVGKTYIHHKYKGYPRDEDIGLEKVYPSYKCIFKNNYTEIHMDQMDAVLYDLRNDPFSRRIMTNLYNLEDLNEMRLYPCAYSMTYNVTRDGSGGLVLNAILNQRSQDILTANNWNVAQYAILMMMIAQSTNMKPGELIHVISDAHVYDRHIEMMDDLCSREEFSAPKVKLNKNITDFYKFTTNDLIVEDYETGPQIVGIPVAV